jgi:DNA-binding NtrC family response regulator
VYYRLKDVVIRIPPLRERLCDLGQIVGTIRRTLSAEFGSRRFPDLSEKQIQLLGSYSWPGNIRQLESVLRRAYLVGIEEHLEQALQEEKEEGLDQLLNSPESLPASSAPLGSGRKDQSSLLYDPNGAKTQPLTFRQAQMRYAMKALESHGGNLTKTAKILDISVNTLKKLRQESVSKQNS